MLDDEQAGPSGVDSARFKALVLAREKGLREKVIALLRPHCRSVLEAKDINKALDLLADQRPLLVVTDMATNTRERHRLIRMAPELVHGARVIVVLEEQDMNGAVEAIKRGAYDCLSRPLHPERFLNSAKRALEGIEESLAGEQRRPALGVHPGGKTVVGQSACMEAVWEKIEMVKDVSSNVLIQGETGTGKELVAYSIHDSSPRSDNPFVKLNCGAIPKDLLESELFGHEKGAFTGALQQRIGRFEMADEGTLLLDEIGDMPLDLQVKLLGVLEDRFVQRVGGGQKIPVDVRIIAATHQDLPSAIEEKSFREDLYYRLNVITIHVPPLRQRKEDVPLLVEHFLRVYRRQTGRDVRGITSDAMDVLMAYDFPGNVRELENIIESGVVLAAGDQITVRELPGHLSQSGREGNEIIVRPGMPLSEVERMCIIETLRHTGGNKQAAADLLGITARSIYRKIDSYGISLENLINQAG